MSEEAPDPEALARVGQTVGGKYQLLRLLGAGGMGAVYEAENTWIKRRVAIKVLHKDLAQNKEVLRRFMQEAQSSTQIEHPNIVYVLDMGQEPSDGSFFIVQEFLQGTDLRKTLDEIKRMPVRQALEIAAPVLSAMAAAHDRGIIHRDLKPENIFLVRGPNGEVTPKVIDFGISKVLNDNGASLSKTRTGISVGTPYYMSPEQARGDTNIDAGADVWSLGIMLYEMVSGTMPFDAPNYNLLIIKIVTEKPRRLEEVATDVPADFAALVHRAIEPDRAQRFPNARALLNAVVQYASACADPFGFSLPSGFTGPVNTGGGVPHAMRPSVSGAVPMTAMQGAVATGSQPGMMSPGLMGSQPGAPATNTMGARPGAMTPPPPGVMGSQPGMMSPAGMIPSQPGMMAPGMMGSQPGMTGSQPGMMAPGMIPSHPGMMAPPPGGYMQGTAPTMLGGMGMDPALRASQAGPTPMGWTGPQQSSGAGRAVGIALAAVLLLGGVGLGAFLLANKGHGAAVSPSSVAMPAPVAVAPPPAMPEQPMAMPAGALAMGDPTAAPNGIGSTAPTPAPVRAARENDEPQQAPRANSHDHDRDRHAANTASNNTAPPPSSPPPGTVAPPPPAVIQPPPPVVQPPPPAVNNAGRGGVRPAPSYPVYGQASSLASRMMNMANQVAATDPRRARRLQNNAARLQTEINEARESDSQANMLDAQNPGAGQRQRDRAARIREALVDRMQRMQEDL